MVIDYIRELDEKYYMGVFGSRIPAAFERGEGMRLYDSAGNSYKDFLAGIAVNALGYSDQHFKEAVKAQIDRLIHTSNYFYNEQQAQLAQDICQRTGYDKVFFGNSGAEANECALKLAQKRAVDKGITDANFVTLKDSFHGRTLATVAATGQTRFHAAHQPPALTVRYIESDDVSAVDTVIDEKTCGVLIETIQGEGGVFPLSALFVKAIRHRCHEVDALLIVDEVQTGMGRTGKFLAQEYLGIRGDVTTLAKSLGNGIPIGACLATKEAAATFGPGDHGSTFGGNHLACVAARYMIKTVDDRMCDDIYEMGQYFKYELFKLHGKYDAVQDVRGLGLMLGLQLSGNIDAHETMLKLFDLGFIVGTAGANTLRFLPPYIVTKQDIQDLIGALEYLFTH